MADPTSIQSWIDSLSYPSFLNALSYVFRRSSSINNNDTAREGSRQTLLRGGVAGENNAGEASAARRNRQNVSSSAAPSSHCQRTEELELLQSLLIGISSRNNKCMFRIRSEDDHGRGDRLLFHAGIHSDRDAANAVKKSGEVGVNVGSGLREHVSIRREGAMMKDSTAKNTTMDANACTETDDDGEKVALPSDLISILASAGVHRSMSQLLGEYTAAREDSDDDNEVMLSGLNSALGIADVNNDGNTTENTHWWKQELEMHILPNSEIAEYCQEADDKMITWATLFPVENGDLNQGSDNSHWCLSLVPDLYTDNIASHSTESHRQNTCLEGKVLKSQLMDILRIASRGKFLSTPPPTTIKIEDPSNSEYEHTVEWFDPHQWFSLPSYLVSRLEIGLWIEFHKSQTVRNGVVRSKKENKTRIGMPSILHKINSLNDNERNRVWHDAFGTVLRTELMDGKNRLQLYEIDNGSNNDVRILSSRFHTLREALVVELVHSDYLLADRTTDASAVIAAAPTTAFPIPIFCRIPLLQWCRPISRLKRLVYNQLQDSYSREIQRSLLLEIDTVNEGHGGSKKKKQKKRKKRKKSSAGNQVNLGSNDGRDSDELCAAADEQIVCHTADDDDYADNPSNQVDGDQDSSNDTDDNDLQVELVVHMNKQTAKSAVASLPEQLSHIDNDAKILVLKVIDDVIQSVFERVGGDAAVEDDSSRGSLDIVEAVSTDVQDNQRSDTNVEAGSAQSPQLASTDADDSLFPQLSKDDDGVACPLQEQDIIHNLLQPGEHSTEPNSTAASVASSEADLGLDITGGDDLGPLDESNKAVHFERFNRNASFEMPSPATSVSSHRSAKTPPPPPTPPPQLSPILVSLADLGKLRKEAAPTDFSPRDTPKVDVKSAKETSPPRSPLKLSSGISLTDDAPLTRNFSRDDLRSIDERRRPHRRDKDHHSVGRPQLERVNRNVDALLSYRNVVAQSSVHRKHSHEGKQKSREEVHPLARSAKGTTTPRSSAWAPADFLHPRSSITSAPSSKEPIINKILHLDVAYARSECALDGVEDASHCNVIPRAHTDDTMTKDGATTISSVRSIKSPQVEEQFATVKEERDSYRDHCLMLGAENAALRNLLASKTCAPLFQAPPAYLPEQVNPYFYASPSYQFHFGHDYNRGSVHPVAAAMSDAGIHRGEHELSVRSEDGTDNMHPSVIGMSVTQNSVSWQAVGDSVHSMGRRTSVGGTCAESDTSQEQNAGHESQTFSAFRQVNHQDSFFGPMPVYGMRSRLSQGKFAMLLYQLLLDFFVYRENSPCFSRVDIDHFMQALKSQLKRSESRRMYVIERITKAVNAVWPRAQIKMYGSHMSRLCLPSSDMDFVICLPAVHRANPAQAPGDLEGRNAINETNQKVLARKLKGESWLGMLHSVSLGEISAQCLTFVCVC